MVRNGPGRPPDYYLGVRGSVWGPITCFGAEKGVLDFTQLNFTQLKFTQLNFGQLNSIEVLGGRDILVN